MEYLEEMDKFMVRANKKKRFAQENHLKDLNI